MKNSPLLNISSDICTESISVAQSLREIHQYEIATQLQKSCSSIGANIREAQFAETKKDFVHKLNISLKECNESLFWLYTIKESNLIDSEKVKILNQNCFRIVRILRAAIKTTKERYNIT